MQCKVVLVDVNPKMVQAWRSAFEDEHDVQVVQGSLLGQAVDAWVSPTNSQGLMSGGLDAAVRAVLGGRIQARLRNEIARRFQGFLPVGAATCVETGRALPGWLVSTPTMVSAAEDVSATLNVALACGAAFQAIAAHTVRGGSAIRSVALPGLGAGTGRVPVEVCADLMWTAYNSFRDGAFDSFDSMRSALELQLGDLGPTTTQAGAWPYRSPGMVSRQGRHAWA